MGLLSANVAAAQWGRLVLLGNEETGDSEMGRTLDGLNGENAY